MRASQVSRLGLALCLASVAALCGCGKSKNTNVTEADIIGKWNAVDIESSTLTPDLKKGILKNFFPLTREFKADHSAIGNSQAGGLIPEGKWSLKDGTLTYEFKPVIGDKMMVEKFELENGKLLGGSDPDMKFVYEKLAIADSPKK